MMRFRKLMDSNVLFGFMVFWILIYVVPRAYTYFNPPVLEFTVSFHERKGDYLIASGTMFKNRCRFSGLNAIGKREDGSSAHIAVKFLDGKADDSANREHGFQSWGPWLIGVANVKTVDIEASHWCYAYGIKQKWAEHATQTILLNGFKVPLFLNQE